MMAFAEFFEDRRAAIFGRNCGTLLDRTYLPSRVLPLKRYDICATSDGRVLVSERFKHWCGQQSYHGLRFRKVSEQPPYYDFEPTDTVEFDAQRAGTRFEDKCSICGNFESVVGTYPLGLRNVTSPLQHGFFRTDLEFGSRWEKSPLIMVGIRTKEAMKIEKFRLVDYEPIMK
jgi:hypothetical protein